MVTIGSLMRFDRGDYMVTMGSQCNQRAPHGDHIISQGGVNCKKVGAQESIVNRDTRGCNE